METALLDCCEQYWGRGEEPLSVPLNECSGGKRDKTKALCLPHSQVMPMKFPDLPLASEKAERDGSSPNPTEAALIARGINTKLAARLRSDGWTLGKLKQTPSMLAGMGQAFIELGRFDEAIVAGKKALRQSRSYPQAYRCLAAAFAHLGRDAEAREAAARLLELDPATISAWIGRGAQSNAKLLFEGLRKAGLPE